MKRRWMNRVNVFAVVPMLALVGGLVLPGASAGEMTVILRPDTVSVSGVRPDNPVALVGVGREQNGYATFVRGLVDQVQSDRNGEVHYDVPWQEDASVTWAAIDVKRQEVAFAASSNRLVSTPASSAELVAVSGRRLQVAVARAQAGPWYGALADGGAGDGDGEQNGKVTLTASALRGIEGGPPPVSLEAGDLVVAVDQDTLNLTILKLQAPGASSVVSGREAE